MKNNRRKRFALISGTVILIALTAVLYAYAESGGGANMQYRGNYYIDCAKTSFFKNIGPSFFSLLNNLVFSAIKGLGEWNAAIIKFSLSADLFEIVDDLISPLFAAIHKYIFNGFSLTLIVLAGMYFIVLLAKQNMMGIISGIVSLVAVIALAGAFFLYPMDILTTVNNLSVELSASVLDAPYESSGGTLDTGNLSTAEKAENIVWNTLVHRPWQIIEFGDVETAERYERTILGMACDTKERQDYVQNMYEEKGLFAPTSSYQLERLSMGLLLLLFDALVFAVMSLFCILIIGYQFFAILLALLGTFIFLMALLPRYGLKLVGNWAVKILSTMAIRIVLIFFLTIIFVIMGYVYGLTGTYGVIPVLFLMVSIIAIIALKRKELLGLFSGYDQPTGFVNKMLNADGNIIRHGVNQYQDLRIAGQRKEMRNRAEQQREVRDAINAETLQNLSMRNEILRNKLATQENPADRQLSEAQLREYHEKAAANIDVQHTRDMQRAQQQEAPGQPQTENAAPIQVRSSARAAGTTASTPAAGAYTRKQRAQGIELLRQSYEQSKTASEAEAQRSNQPVQYTPFVQRTNHLRAMNPDAEFDSRDVERAARIVHDTEARGGSVSELRTRMQTSQTAGNTDAAVKRRLSANEAQNPSTDQKSQAAPVRTTNDSHTEKHVRQEESNLKGLAYFQVHYGDEKGERFYNTMREKYGKTATDFSAEKKLTPAQIRRRLETERETERVSKVKGNEPRQSEEKKKT